MSMRDLSQKSLKITLQLPHLPISFRYVVRNNSVQLVGLMSPVKRWHSLSQPSLYLCVSMEGTSIHRRKSSKDHSEEEFTIPVSQSSAAHLPSIVLAPAPPPMDFSQQGHSRSTSIAGTSLFNPRPTSVGPYRTTFNGLSDGQPLNGTDGSNMPTSISTKSMSGHSHSRTRSVSGPFLPSQRSPLASSFANKNMPSSFSSHSINTTPFPVQLTSPKSLPLEDSHTVTLNDPSSPKPGQRHTRLHSRNLSIFFPRPGSLPTYSIAEDGSQELELKVDIEAPVTTIPSAGSSVQFPRSQSISHGHAPPTPLGVGFAFGGRPSATSNSSPPLMDSISSSSSTSSITKSRRGHHHKHSMSHSFFSFLEPGTARIGSNGMPILPTTPSESVHTPQSTSVPVSPWKSTSLPTASTLNQLHYENESSESVSFGPAMGALGQFLLGAWLWVCGQRIGSLSCTGIGYWIVFDSFGIGIAKVLPGRLNLKDELANTRERERGMLKRPYGYALVKMTSTFQSYCP